MGKKRTYPPPGIVLLILLCVAIPPLSEASAGEDPVVKEKAGFAFNYLGRDWGNGPFTYFFP